MTLATAVHQQLCLKREGKLSTNNVCVRFCNNQLEANGSQQSRLEFFQTIRYFIIPCFKTQITFTIAIGKAIHATVRHSGLETKENLGPVDTV
jgi:hypothetical protein